MALPAIFIGLGLAMMVMMVFGGTHVDRSLLVLMHGPDEPGWREAADTLTRLARPEPLLIASGAGVGLLLARRAWRRAAFLIGIAVGGMVVVHYLGVATIPARPALDGRLAASDLSRFPDPYTAAATIVWLSLAFLLTRHHPARPLALIGALTVALATGGARLLPGEAWPSDVIGAWAFGLLWTLLLLRIAGEDISDGAVAPPRSARPERPIERSPLHRDHPAE